MAPFDTSNFKVYNMWPTCEDINEQANWLESEVTSSFVLDSHDWALNSITCESCNDPVNEGNIPKNNVKWEEVVEGHEVDIYESSC